MNLSTAVFLMDTPARAIKAVYDPDRKDEKPTMFKTFDKTIKVDDYIVVVTDTRHNMTVCKVTEVDSVVDFESPVQIQWALGRIDLADADAIRQWEARAITAIQEAEKLRKRNELKDSMKALIAETGGDLKLLSMSSSPVPTQEPEAA